MSTCKISIAAVAAAVLVAGCDITPTNFETTPVRVDTKQGPVICQLYTQAQVAWDRAVDRPESMDVETADEICRTEGERVQEGGQPDYDGVEPAALG
ncbi:hypothetical protein [Paracoccus sediminicola]|uniref:hypothetical protein n=1 Tax=Paracoccus sediminicola TaxID=3017783 RepID=UPI0022F01B5B|nr:hypothetical protein [Paracoccus sediminicola]WBU56895.1 hypothetical protein PAF18_00145 [Paracoccus sediminicola]